MKQNTLRLAAMTAVIVASALYSTHVHAQSADALLDKLVDKTAPTA